MRQFSSRAASGAVAVALAAVTLAGCQGGSAEPARPAASSVPAGNGIVALGADEILQRARAALTAAKSFRVEGTMVKDDETSELDFRINGPDFAGTMSMGPLKVELLAVGGGKYMRANEQFFVSTMGEQQGRTVGKALSTRWISGSDGDPSFTSLFTMGTVDEILSVSGTAAKGEEKVVDGVPAIGLTDSGEPGTTLYIATTGEPYPLRMTGPNGVGLVYSGIGAVTDIQPPAAGTVVDLNKVPK